MMKTCPSSVRLPRGTVGTLAACASLAISLLWNGCANYTEVKVDSLAKPKAEDAIAYKIHNANPAIDEDTLRHKEAVGFVRTALSGKGIKASVLPDAFKEIVFTNDPDAASLATDAQQAKAVGLLTSTDLNGIFDLGNGKPSYLQPAHHRQTNRARAVDL